MKRAGVAAVAGAVIVAFGGGVVTGAATRGGHPSAGGDTVVDQAERAIEAHAAKPVSASALQQAAVEGMLKALGDPWSAYYEPSQFARFQQTLLQYGMSDEATLAALYDEVEAQIQEGLEFAQASPSPKLSELTRYVYSEAEPQTSTAAAGSQP